MKIDQLTALIVRLFVIYLSLVVFFPNGMFLISLVAQGGTAVFTETVGYIMLLTAALIILAFLWRHPLFVAGKIILQGSGESLKTPLSYDELQTLCFTVLGLWITADSLVNTLQYMVSIEWAKMKGATVQTHLFGYSIRLIVGIGIMLGASGISKAIQSLRGKK